MSSQVLFPYARFQDHPRRRLLSLGVAVLLALAALAVLPAPQARAHGAVDQSIQPLPGNSSTPCDATNFPGFVLSADNLRQEFQPSVSGLSGVDLCLRILTPGTNVSVNVRQFGAGAAAPGPTLANRTRLVLNPNEVGPDGTGWLHIDFSNPDHTNQLPLVGGTKYVLEIERAQVTFQWRTTCGTTLSPCAPGTPDRYPAGQTNFGSAIGDFGFRTLPGHLANLQGAVTSIGGGGVACPGQARDLTARVSNLGQNGSGPFRVGFYLSTDDVITKSDHLIGTKDVGSLAAGASTDVVLTGATLPDPAGFRGRARIGAIVDDNNTVNEFDESDNTGSAAVAIFCGNAGVSALTLTGDRATVPAGSIRVPLDSIPAEDIGFAATGAESAPTHQFSLSSTPTHQFPTHQFFTGVPQEPLNDISLAEVPIEGGWEPRLANTIYAHTPTQSISLGQFVSLPPCGPGAPSECNPNVPLTIGEMDFARSPLRGITLAAVATAGATLRNLAVVGPGNPPQEWCVYLGGQGYDCAAYGINPNSTSLLGMILLGAQPSIQWSTMPFATMDLTGSPLYNVKLKEFAVLQTPARLFPISGINNPATFVSCTGCATLGAAAEAGAIKDGPTFGQLIAALSDKNGTLGSTTLGDYLMGLLLDRNSWSIGALGLGRAPLFAGTGEHVTNTLTLTAESGAGTAPIVDPVLRVTPPPGFLVVPGTSRIAYPATGSFANVADPVAAGGGLEWKVSEIVSPGTSLKLEYRLAPGLDLEIAGSTVSMTAVDQFGAVTAGPFTNQAPVQVLDAETLPGEANDDITAGPLLAPGVKQLGHVSSATDVDYYRVAVPVGPTCDISGIAGEAGAGCRLRIIMGMTGATPPTDFDLVVYGPAVDTTTQGAPTHQFPTHQFPTHQFSLEDDQQGAQKTQTETLQDSPTHQFPTHQFPTHQFSAVRGTSEEFAEVVVTSGQTGHFTIQVHGYNGSSGPKPYALGVTTLPPLTLGPCPVRNFDYVGVDQAAPAVPDTMETLILWDPERTGALYGPNVVDAPASSDDLLGELTTFAASVNGVVYPVGSDPASAAALADYDQNPCDVAVANTAVAKISELIASIKDGKPNFKYVVIVGSDELIPMVRIIDNTSLANESDYAPSIAKETQDPGSPKNNALLAASVSHHFLSDDAYATDEVIDSAGHPIFVAKWAVGRLVETPAQIRNSLQKFALTGGLADAPPDQTALITGYDFASDGSEEAAAPLAARLGNDKVGKLICDTWSRNDLIGNILDPAAATPVNCPAPNTQTSPPDIIGINGHADNFRLLPAIGNLNNDESDMVKPVDLPVVPGRVIFSVGCHFGLNVANTINANPTAEQIEQTSDWPENLAGNRAAIVLANTGYGYGDTEAAALSERLTADFAANLDGTKTVGQALVAAKQNYFLNHMGVYGPYDEKVMQQAVMYGPPMFAVVGEGGAGGLSASAAAQTIEPLSTDGTGLAYRAFDSGQLVFDEEQTSRGTILSVDGDVLVQDRQPIVPQKSYDATNTDPAFPSHKAVGLFITGVTSGGRPGFDPVFARAEFDAGHKEPQSRGIFPTAPGAISTLGNQQRLLLWPGKFAPDGGKEVTGDMLLRTNVTGKLYYSNAQGKAPRILRVDSQFVDEAETMLSFTVRTSGEGTTVKRVGVLVNSVFKDLVSTGANVWTGTITLPAEAVLKDVLVQALSANGVGYWANKGGKLEPPAPGGDGLAINVAGTKVNGWYLDDATATVEIEGGGTVPLEYSLDGKAYEGYNPLTGIQVTGTGIHPLLVRGYDNVQGRVLTASTTILIDADAPTIAINSPAEGATYSLNSSVTPNYDCADAGSGLATCTGPATVDTSSPGQHSYSVTATDVATNSATKTVTYTVAPDTTAPTISIVTPPNGATYNRGSTVLANYSCADTGGAGLVSCTASVGSTQVANGQAIPTSEGGLHTFTVVAVDGAGNTSSASTTYTIPGMRFEGFFSPVTNVPGTTTATAGSTIPFKFQVFNADGTEYTSTVGFQFKWKTYNCSTGAESGVALTAVPITPFRYDSAQGFFQFDAKTEKNWANSCRKFIVTLPDLNTRYAQVRFVK